MQMILTGIQMITLQKKESPKLQTHLDIYPALLFSALLVCSLVFLPSSYSRAGGVNSNTTSSGTTTSASTGNSTSSTVTNDDGSTTTTTNTPTTTTTTQTTVTQTEIPNIVENPIFTNQYGGGSYSGWSITQCPGSCAFSPTLGFQAGNGGTITQTFSATDIFGNDVDSTEQAQGLTFSFGAEVDNDQAGNNVADTWSIQLELFNSGGSTIGSTTIGSTVIFSPTIKTGTLEIDSGITPYTGTLTLFGDTAFSGGYCCGPFFNDVFTTYLYNSIETTITTDTTYADLITTVSCEVLDSCVAPIVTELPIGVPIISPGPNNDVAILAPSPIETMPTLPSGGPSNDVAGPGVQLASVDLSPPPVVEMSVQTPSMETTTQSQMETQISNIEMEIENDTSSETMGTTPSQDIKDISTPEPESTSESAVESSTEQEPESNAESNAESSAEQEPAAKPQDAASSDSKPEPKQEVAESKTKKGAVRTQPAKKQKVKSVSVKKQEKQKAATKRQKKQKAATKMVKKMGDKGKYENSNQLKTLVIMQVLGNTKSFFSTQKMLQDTPGFFTVDKIPDTQISDNNIAAYYMIGGSDAKMDALTDTQYRR